MNTKASIFIPELSRDTPNPEVKSTEIINHKSYLIFLFTVIEIKKSLRLILSGFLEKQWTNNEIDDPFDIKIALGCLYSQESWIQALLDDSDYPVFKEKINKLFSDMRISHFGDDILYDFLELLLEQCKNFSRSLPVLPAPQMNYPKNFDTRKCKYATQEDNLERKSHFDFDNLPTSHIIIFISSPEIRSILKKVLSEFLKSQWNQSFSSEKEYDDSLALGILYSNNQWLEALQNHEQYDAFKKRFTKEFTEWSLNPNLLDYVIKLFIYRNKILVPIN